MKYEEFDNKHRRERNIIALYGGIAFLALLIIFLIRETSRSLVIYKSAPAIDSYLLKEDICYQGFHSIVSKNALTSLVIENYAKALEEETYSMIDFSFSKDNLRRLEVIKNVCKIIILDNKTLRSFQITLNESFDHQFHYKISNISELILEEGDLE